LNINVYGAILNPGCRFADKRIGQSTTLTGRQISKHMASKINEIITGEYNHTGQSIIYGDSVTGDTKIKTTDGEMTIEDLFNQCRYYDTLNEKEYGIGCDSKVVGFNSLEDTTVLSSLSYVMRHKTKKKLYKVVLENGNSITVTEDHSLMIDRDGFLIEIKPTQIQENDLIIGLKTR
jgi:DNA polymerase I